MAYRLRVTAYVDWIPDGAGFSVLGQQQAENPGVTSSNLAGPVGAAQTASWIDTEIVPGGDSPTSANFQTALNNAAASLQTDLTTAGAVPGYTGPNGTLLATIQGWSTGGA